MILEDFYAEILRKLGVLAAEESPTPSDRLEAKNKYEQVFAEYDRRDLTTWFDDEDVPDHITDAFAAMVANRLTSTFSVPIEKKQELLLEADRGLTILIGDGQRRESPDSEVEYY